MANAHDAPIPLNLLLVVEDNPGVAHLIGEVVREEEPDAVEVLHVTRLAEAQAALERHDFDAVLLCLSLPDAFGVETVQCIRTTSPHVPIVVLAGADERIAIDAVREGAQDFIDPAGAALRRRVRRAVPRSRRLQVHQRHPRPRSRRHGPAGGGAPDARRASLRRGAVCASIGIANFPRDGEDVDALVQFADAAMYAEKQRKKNGGDRCRG